MIDDKEKDENEEEDEAEVLEENNMKVDNGQSGLTNENVG